MGTGSYKKLKTKQEEINGDESTAENENIRPLELFIKWLIDKLVSPEWEIRHGASTALREILKQVSSSRMKKENFPQLTGFFEYCLNKLLTVIALDRFADYIGDEAVAPVRETCAQIIGVLSSHLNESSRLAELCQILNCFIQQEDDANWEIRHSGKFFWVLSKLNANYFIRLFVITYSDSPVAKKVRFQ